MTDTTTQPAGTWPTLFRVSEDRMNPTQHEQTAATARANEGERMLRSLYAAAARYPARYPNADTASLEVIEEILGMIDEFLDIDRGPNYRGSV